MSIVYLHQKKEPLTIEEMDGNFAHIEKRLKNLESRPPLAEGIAKLTQEGDQVTVHGTFGGVLGQLTLPKIFPNPRGTWQPETAYRIQDWVQAKQSIYACVRPHSSKDFQEDHECWILVFEGGEK